MSAHVTAHLSGCRTSLQVMHGRTSTHTKHDKKLGAPLATAAWSDSTQPPGYHPRPTSRLQMKACWAVGSRRASTAAGSEERYGMTCVAGQRE